MRERTTALSTPPDPRELANSCRIRLRASRNQRARQPTQLRALVDYLNDDLGEALETLDAIADGRGLEPAHEPSISGWKDPNLCRVVGCQNRSEPFKSNCRQHRRP